MCYHKVTLHVPASANPETATPTPPPPPQPIPCEHEEDEDLYNYPFPLKELYNLYTILLINASAMCVCFCENLITIQQALFETFLCHDHHHRLSIIM